MYFNGKIWCVTLQMDKAYVLREAVNYTRQLQERVKELENKNSEKRVVHHSSTLVRKCQVSEKKNLSNSSESNKESLFEVEARVLDEEILIGIHCEKQKDIVCNILAFLDKLHLSPTSSSVLPFGTCTLIIHIIAQVHISNTFHAPLWLIMQMHDLESCVIICRWMRNAEWTWMS